ncbi:MAG: hypothetical protein LBG48_03980 [Rickettsiales bacterium]|nr:hypothetical protein [Rickettsiales bacterium]
MHDLTSARMRCKKASFVVKELNRKIRGWANYFKIGAVTKSYKHLSHYILAGIATF